MQGRFIIFCFVFFSFILSTKCKQNLKSSSVSEITELKELKKLLRTKNNVLICFISSQKGNANIIKNFKEAADIVKGVGAMIFVDCSGDSKKLCKKLKAAPETYILRHYKDGDFHKVYDRKGTVSSIVNFMRDPTGDLPWEEDETATDVVHIPDIQSLMRLLKKEARPVMVMFYAPWCGFCKQLKPEYSAAAAALKNSAIMAAIDVNRPENAVIRAKFNITGFPTMMYFENGAYKFTYDGDNKKDSLISFMENPRASPPKPQEEDWSESISEVVHLTTDTFDSFMQGESSVLVMFYAPWCGHCKKMKPEYEKAAEKLKIEQISASLAAVDATKESALGKRFGVQSYPTVKFFKNGEFMWDTPSIRDSEKIVSYMKDPKKPPPPPPPEPDWADQPSEVIHLDAESFKTTLRKKRHTLVMFYAPWCGHCKQAKPEFMKAAEETKDNSRLAFAAVDCTKHSTLCKTVEISGYPTFKYYNYYNKSPVRDYSGDRKASDFLLFMEKVDGSGKPSSDTKEKDEKETLVPSNTPSQASHESGKVPSIPSVISSENVGEKPSPKSSSSQKVESMEFSNQPSSPGDNRKPATTKPPHISGKEKIELKSSEHHKPSDHAKTATAGTTLPVHTKHSPQPTVGDIKSPSQSPDSKEPIKSTTQETLTKETVTATTPQSQTATQKPITKETITAGTPQSAARTTQGDIKTPTKPPPASPAGSPPPSDKPKPSPLSSVKMWVGVVGAEKIVHLDDSNYKDILKKYNSVLVFFYGSWCGSCKTLTAEYGQAALKLNPSEGVLAACDGTDNEKIIDDYKISKLPSLKLFTKGQYVEDYTGKTNAEEIIKFMKGPPKLQKQEL